MNPRHFKVLVAVATVSLLAAVLSLTVLKPVQGTVVDEVGELFFPALDDRLDSVHRIRVRSGGEELSITRREDGRWGIDQMGGYPADQAAVARTLEGMTRLRPVATKTSNPGWFRSLGLEDYGEGAASSEVTLLDRDGQPVAEILTGLGSRYEGGRESGFYAREIGGETAYLVRGNFLRTPERARWLNRKLFDFGESEVASIEIKAGEGLAVTIGRRAETGEWAILNMPEGAQLKRDGIAASGVNSFVSLMFRDAKRRDELPAELRDPMVSTVRLNSGLSIDVTTARTGDQTYYATLDTHVDPVLSGSLPDGGESLRRAAASVQSLWDEWAYQIDYGAYLGLRRNIREFIETGDQVGVSHILVTWDGAVASQVRGRTKAEARLIAEQALARAQETPDLWGRIVTEFSDDPTKTIGGNLGVITRGEFIPEFEEAAFDLDAGEISGIVESPLGYHIIRRNR